MGTRAINFELNDQEFLFDLGTYAVMIYYAKQINPSKAKKLFDGTTNEFWYRFNYELPISEINETNDALAHFIPSEMQEVILFIDNELIPALNYESQDLIEKYGGESNFVKLFYTNPDYLKFIGIAEQDFFEGDAGTLVLKFVRLKKLFQYAISINQPYEVWQD